MIVYLLQLIYRNPFKWKLPSTLIISPIEKTNFPEQ